MSPTVSGAVVGLVDGAGAAAGPGASATLSAGSAAAAKSVRDLSFPPAGDEQRADHGDGRVRKTIGVHAGLGTKRKSVMESSDGSRGAERVAAHEGVAGYLASIGLIGLYSSLPTIRCHNRSPTYPQSAAARSGSQKLIAR